MNELDQPLDLVLLQTFVEVNRLGSVTAAAKSLGRSQPAVSHRLRALESELGVPLFEKIGRRLALTDYGRQLDLQCQDLIALSRGLRDLVREADGPLTGRVRVGTFPTIAAHLMIPTLATMLREHQELELVFNFDLLDPLLERLRTGLVDLVLVFSDREPEGFDVIELGSTRLVAILPPTTASRSRVVSVKQLSKLRYLAWHGPKDPTVDQISAFTSHHKLVNQWTPQIPHVETLRELIASGAGYTILPSYTAHRDESSRRVVTRIPRGLQRKISLYLVGRPGQVHPRALTHVRQQLSALSSSPLLTA